MGKTKTKGKGRLDKYYHLAKEHGYRSRAAWKLIQLDSKFHFLHSSRAVLDLCAAPGGWMQIAVSRVPVGSLVLGIDLVKIAPVRGAIAIEQDITKQECKAKVKKIMSENGVKAFDLVLHDGSPNIGGAWSQEATSQNSLVIDAVKLATQFLAPKGNFVTKVFRSQDYNSVLYCLNQLFEKVEVDKPAASRSTSAEIFVLGFKYKAPAKIDPRLLDVKHLFQGFSEPQRKVVEDVLRPAKQKRHRDGYEDGQSILRKVSSATDFVWSDTPLEVLGSVTSITFEDSASLPIKNHALTTAEVKVLCEDLRVLGKQDFKHLLKWRMHIRKALSPTQKANSTAATDGEEKNEEDEDDKLLNEMEELTYAVDRKKKQAKKRDAKRLAKDKTRKAQGMQIDALEDGYVDNELFSLSSIKGKKDLATVDSAENDVENGAIGESESEEDEAKEDPSSDVDSDEERRRYDEKMEDFLDQVYERFTAKKEGSSKQRKRARKAYSELMEDDDKTEHSDFEDSDKEQSGDEEANPLVVPFHDGNVPTQADLTDKWFSQDVFAKAVQDGDFAEDEMQVDVPEEKFALPEKSVKTPMASKPVQVKPSKAQDDFEIVPAPATDSSDDSSSDESDEDDIDTKAEMLAYAKKMMRKKQREEILDGAYNRYMFDDGDGLPGWFVEEERRHRQPSKPITKEEVNAIKAQNRDIDARCAKKVTQAKIRKKRVAMRKLEKVRKKANTISEQTDLNDRSKGKMIEQLYKKATPKRPKKELVVAKKGVANKAGKGKVLVDRRMKSDKRVHGMNSNRKGKNGKGGKQSGKGSATKGKGKGNAGNKGGRRA
ncbi:AdoMet-dependent rRNA methyltransferase spb1 [Euphorbia peplus]|nr:AdoMet-dependent rRNA methyltransferase spb1 [Euphorbia peplus]